MGKSAFQRISWGVFALFVAISVSTHSHSQVVPSELTVDSYCRLAVELLQVAVAGWQAKIELLGVGGYQGGPELFCEQEMEINARMDAEGDSLCAASHTDFAGYLAFGGGNEGRIERYLGENPELHQQLVNLREQNRALVEEYERLLALHGIRGE